MPNWNYYIENSNGRDNSNRSSNGNGIIRLWRLIAERANDRCSGFLGDIGLRLRGNGNNNGTVTIEESPRIRHRRGHYLNSKRRLVLVCVFDAYAIRTPDLFNNKNRRQKIIQIQRIRWCVPVLACGVRAVRVTTATQYHAEIESTNTYIDAPKKMLKKINNNKNYIHLRARAIQVSRYIRTTYVAYTVFMTHRTWK